MAFVFNIKIFLPPLLYKIGLNSRAVFDNLGRAVNEFMGDNYTNFLSLRQTRQTN